MEPSRSRAALFFKIVIDTILTRVPFLRRLDANMISGLSLVCTLAGYLLISHRMLISCFVALFLALFMDALDGVVARVRGQASSEEGWVVDISVDRVSEALISLALSRVYILLAVLNVGLAFYSYKSKKHVIIPVRHLLLLMLLFYLFVESEAITFFLDGLLFEW